MKRHYFHDCVSIEDAKRRYRILSKEHHPDVGGDTATMQVINAEYRFICSQILSGQNLNRDDFKTAYAESEQYMDVINRIVMLDGITLEIAGSWVWVTGNTYPVRSDLRSAGFFWAHKKHAWFWRPDEAKGGRGKLSLDEIRNKFGSVKVMTGQTVRAIS